ERLAERVASGNVVVNEAPGGLVAKLPTQLVTLTNKQGEPLQKLWIEPNTGMILKRELYTRGGVLQASSEFTEVNLGPRVDPTDFNLPRGARIVTPETKLDAIIRRQGFQNVRLPAGTPYRLENVQVKKIAGQEVLVQQYAGGGHRIALYQIRTVVDPSRFVGLPSGVRTYAWQTGGSSFVLMGDLRDAELRELARRLGG
ncbi:MAG: hypothetical protein ACHQ50_12490, partial [Fimbriimonadales bacterium]